ncbi:MAG: hypothetical protein ACLR4Z_00920 [Butyricicoccaceae bacterium]
MLRSGRALAREAASKRSCCEYDCAPAPLGTVRSHALSAAVAVGERTCGTASSRADRIAVGGFSAGAHLAGLRWRRCGTDAVMVSTGNGSRRPIRPNAAVLCYPVVSAGKYAHRGSFAQSGRGRYAKNSRAFSLETLVSPRICRAPSSVAHADG